jgi:hypothetical protein
VRPHRKDIQRKTTLAAALTDRTMVQTMQENLVLSRAHPKLIRFVRVRSGVAIKTQDGKTEKLGSKIRVMVGYTNKSRGVKKD